MSSRTRIKICGLKDPAHVTTAAEAGADAIGLVFAAKSPRCLTLEQARALTAAAPPFLDLISLFAAADLDEIRRTIEPLPVRTVQLHGDYTPEQLASLEGFRVIRAVGYDPATFSETLARWDHAHRELDNLAGLLIDTPRPDHYGGTGERFDWPSLRSALEEANPRVPIILAGGLTPENVTEAIQTVAPYAVDVSSGVEAQRGVKDPHRIRAFCRAARSIDTESRHES